LLEVDRAPPAVIVDKVLRDCGLAPEGLTLVLTPTTSLAGTTQVVARVLEVALHKGARARLPAARIVEGSGCAPLPPPAHDTVTAMGRTNDAILYGGQVHLACAASRAAAPSSRCACRRRNSRDHGRPFAELFAPRATTSTSSTARCSRRPRCG
jgi:methenyltetrahydromethanopterin cyclohydrolase